MACITFAKQPLQPYNKIVSCGKRTHTKVNMTAKIEIPEFPETSKFLNTLVPERTSPEVLSRVLEILKMISNAVESIAFNDSTIISALKLMTEEAGISQTTSVEPRNYQNSQRDMIPGTSETRFGSEKGSIYAVWLEEGDIKLTIAVARAPRAVELDALKAS